MGNNPSKGPPINKWQHVPRSATLPSPPGWPELVPPPTDEYLLQFHQPDVITLRWKPPEHDGGTPISGYLVERRDMGTSTWVRAHAALTREPEINLAGLEPSRRYQFRVIAENALGFSDPSEASAPISLMIGMVATVPHFLKELKDIVAVEHEKVTFSVHILGTPSPAIAWYKDSFEVFNSKRVQIVTDNERSSITFYQVALSDEGEIKCTATNRAGHIVSRANLTVDAPPRVKIPKTYEEGIILEIGEVIRLKATLSGRPSPIVHWLHNGEELQNDKRCEITTTDRITSLRLLDTNRDDRGEYMVRATNDLGEDVAAVLVTITDRPQPPSKPEIVSHRNRTVMLEWRAPLDDGGCRIGSFVVEYYKFGWDVWLKAAVCRQLSATLEDLIEGSEYKFRIKAENPYGMSDPGEESEVIFIADPRRGIYKPQAKEASDVSNIATDEWLEERRRRRAEMFGEPLPPIKPPEPQPPKPEEKVAVEKVRPVKDEKKVEETHVDEEEEEEESEFDEDDEMESSGEEDLDEEEVEEEEEEEEEIDADDQSIHRANSDELMVVLVPSNDKLNDDENKQDESAFAVSTPPRPPLKQQESLDAPPPPMSLSAPDLSSLSKMASDLTPIQFQRNAVSSTELLHEKAMARLYQALAAEEARNEKKRQETIEAEDAMEMSQAPEQDLPRAKITDTGQEKIEEILPPPPPPTAPQKPPLKSVLKKPKRKIPELKSEDGDDLDIKKNKPDSDYKRPITPVTFSDLVYGSHSSDADLSLRPVSPYLRGPFLHHDYDDVDMGVVLSSSRPITPRSLRSARSVSPFSKVVVMDKPPEGVVLEPSPPPLPSPPTKVKKPRRFKKSVIEQPEVPREIEIFKVPQELPQPEKEMDEPPAAEVIALVVTEIMPEEPNAPRVEPQRKTSLRRSKPVESRVQPKIEDESSAMEITVDEITKAPEGLKVKMGVDKENTELQKETLIPRVVEKRKPQLISEKKDASVFQEKTNVELEAPKPADSPLPSKESSGSPKKEKRGLVARLFEKKPKKQDNEKAAQSNDKKDNKKDKKDKKDDINKEVPEDKPPERPPKENKGFSILGVKLRRPAEMVREGDDALAKRNAFQKKDSVSRMSTESSKATEEAEARAIVIDRYGELINDFSSGRISASKRLYLDRDELKAQAGDDEDPLEEFIKSTSDLGRDDDRSSSQIKLPTDDEHAVDEETWEEEEIAEIPPSPPRSATPKHTWTTLQVVQEEEKRHSSRAVSKAASRAATGETSAPATITKATNIAVGLFVLWLSYTIHWHIGLAVVVFVVLRKLYLFAKQKFLQVTGLQRREPTPEPEPGDDVPDPSPLPGLASLMPPPTPPTTPSLLSIPTILEENEEEEFDEQEEGVSLEEEEGDEEGLGDDEYAYEYEYDEEDEEDLEDEELLLDDGVLPRREHSISRYKPD